jgi:hypothetical protein
MFGRGYVSGSVTRLRRRMSPHGPHVPSFFITMCRGLAHGEVERCTIPSLQLLELRFGRLKLFGV